LGATCVENPRVTGSIPVQATIFIRFATEKVLTNPVARFGVFSCLKSFGFLMPRPPSKPPQNNFFFKPPVNFGLVNEADRLFQQGLAHLNQGSLEQAREFFEKVVKINTKHFDAFHLLGIIAAQFKAFKEADVFFEKAIKLNPNNAAYFCNRGNVLKELKQFQAAITHYNKAIDINKNYALAYLNKSIALCDLKRFEEALMSVDKAIQVKPDYAEACFQRGFNLTELKRLDEALVSYDKAIEIKRDFAEAYSGRGAVLKELNRFDEALASYSKAIHLNHGYAEAYFNQGLILSKLNRFEESLDNYNQAIEHNGNYPEAYSNRGNVLKDLQRFDEALASYGKALELNDGYAEAYFNQGLILFELNQIEESLSSYNKAIELKRDYAEAYLNRGNVLQEARMFDEALICYDKAIEIKHSYAEAYLNKSLLLLLRQDFEKGWALYEWRWKKLELTSSHRNFIPPVWLGNDSLERKTILLHAEQGLGDTLQFCRYVCLVKNLGARVLLEVPKSLMELLNDLEGVDELIETGQPLPAFDYHCPLLSLPLAFKTKLETIPFSRPYLKANQEKISHWQKRISDLNGLKVGLVWNGGFRPNQPELWALNARRNIPLKIFAQKFNLINVNFFSLQKGDPAESEIRGREIEFWPRGNFFNFSDELVDFSDTAALISHMDLIISVDTSTAHLAGALGKPTWILNRFDSCWRWMLERDDSPWYESVKLYRQGEDRQWEPVLERVVNDLLELIK